MSATRRLRVEELDEAVRPRWLGLSIDWAAVTSVLVAAITTRIMIFASIYLSMATIPMRWGELPYVSPGNLLLDGLVRHDSFWYMMIATQGYITGDATAARPDRQFAARPVAVERCTEFDSIDRDGAADAADFLPR